MIKYAIAGNIASGKSAVEKILKDNGCAVIDTDKISHKLLENNQEVLKAFQNYDITENGKISRSKLGKIVFSNQEMKQKLENILHPQIKEKIVEFFRQNSDKDKVFVSIPLVFEANMGYLFNKIIFIYTDDNIRLERLMKRNGYSKDYALKRMQCQQSQDDKIKKSDIIIYNNSTLDELKNNVMRLIL